MGEAQGENRKRISDRIPEFWIRPQDKRGRPLDSRVLDASRHLWPWAYRHVEIELHDGARAAELLEEVAMDVSARLRVEPEVERNLNGYLITAFHHRVRSQLLRDSRLAYEGLLCELEEKHQPRAPDWAKALETKLALKFLVAYLPHQTKHMLNYRTLGFSWKEIARFAGITVAQAKSRFHYGVQKAYETLLENQARRRKDDKESER
jgi:DNA-directed RNA polymerase specialized sigma24 family protein